MQDIVSDAKHVVLSVIIFLVTVFFFVGLKAHEDEKALAKAKAKAEALAAKKKEPRNTARTDPRRHFSGKRQTAKATENAVYGDMKQNSDGTYLAERSLVSAVNRIHGTGVDFVPGIRTIRSISKNELGKRSMLLLIRLASDRGIIKILETKKLHIDELREQTSKECESCLGLNSGQGRSIGINCTPEASHRKYDIEKEKGNTLTEKDAPHTLVDTLIHELAHCDETGGKTKGHDKKFHKRRKELKEIYRKELRRRHALKNDTTITGINVKTTSQDVADQFLNLSPRTARKAINESKGDVTNAMNQLVKKKTLFLKRNAVKELRLTQNNKWTVKNKRVKSLRLIK